MAKFTTGEGRGGEAKLGRRGSEKKTRTRRKEAEDVLKGPICDARDAN